VDDLEAAGDGELPPTAADAAPLLVLTTGTTGEPKGIHHDWRRLLATAKDRRPEPGSRWLLAYNLHQFAGIQMLVHVLSVGGTLVVPPSNQPVDAVETMLRHDVTHASATPTFWRFLLAQLARGGTPRPAKLSQITLGGEAVNAAVLTDLRAAFPDARISHIYAATEIGSAVSVRDEEIGLPASVLERGADDDVRFKIVDGELWAASRIGMVGSDEWRATGDLVEVRGDRIVFMGRTSEIINVGGVKVHPLPIEEIVLEVPGVELARVFGRDNPISGQIVAVDVVVTDGEDEDKVTDAIRDACADLPPASRPRRIRAVENLEILGGKVKRS
jgi:acyl-CoA synthetase (AMP-forming)/AMP-acid ligase II